MVDAAKRAAGAKRTRRESLLVANAPVRFSGLLAGLTLRHEIANIHADVSRDLAQQSRRDIAARVERHCRDAAIGMAKLLVRAPLTNLGKPESHQDRNHLARLENRDVRHGLGHANGMSPDKLSLEPRITILEQHGDNLAEVLVELIQRGGLRMSSRPARHVADEEPRGGITLDHSGERTHEPKVARFDGAFSAAASG